MSAEAQKQFLVYLSGLSIAKLRKLSTTFSRSEIKALRELALNLIKGNIPCSELTKQALIPYKKFLRELAAHNVKRCRLARYCKGLLILLKAAKDIVEQL